jgi:hypothetical protein
MDEAITSFVGLDAHAESTAIAVAEAGYAAPRFVGTVGTKSAELSKALAKLGGPARLLVVYEAARAAMRWRASSGVRATAVRWWPLRRCHAGRAIG